VADQTYWNEQYFYYNGKIEPINMMRTAAGMGALNGAYFCVRGDPSQTIQKENGWWKSIRVLRKTISSFEWNKNGELNKLECQLKKSGTPMFLLNANMCHADEE
jgi:ABC-type tungstate transport system permease subunit